MFKNCFVRAVMEISEHRSFCLLNYNLIEIFIKKIKYLAIKK